jgi:PTS system galactitol-specific IIA component
MPVLDFLKQEAICLQVDLGSSEEIIRLLGGKLHALGYVKDGFIEATLKREASMPTGLPLGGEYNAALPHVDIEFVNKSALALATLTHPVVFKNMVDDSEEVPVRMVIMLALDKPKSQIEMLKEISQILKRPETVRALVAAQTAQEVVTILADMAAPPVNSS